MGDRTRQIAREWLAKCADVVLDARELARARARDAGRRARMKANRWFNCACARRRETTSATERDDAARDARDARGRKNCEGDSVDAFVEGAVTVDVYLERGGGRVDERRTRARRAMGVSRGRGRRTSRWEQSFQQGFGHGGGV